MGMIRGSDIGRSAITQLNQIPGLALELDTFSLNLADNTAFATWPDSSGNGRAAVQATGTKQPKFRTNQLNGLPVVEFDGGDGLQTPSFFVSTFSIFTVFKASANGIVYELGPDAGTTAGFYLYTDVTNSCLVDWNPATGRSAFDIIANWGIDGVWRIAEHVYLGTHAQHRVLLDALSPKRWVETSANEPGTAGTTNALNVGARNNAASVFLTGHIAHLALFTPALSYRNRHLARSLLAEKWGFTLP